MTWYTAGDDRPSTTRCLVLQPRSPSTSTDRHDIHARLEEAVGLAEAIDLLIVHSEVISIVKPRPSSLLGKGIVGRLANIVATKNVEVAVVDADLSPMQQRNLEEAWKCKVLDRTGLIIEIFGLNHGLS